MIDITLDSSCLNIKKRDEFLNIIWRFASENIIRLYTPESVQGEQTRPEIRPDYSKRYRERILQTQPISDTTTFPISFGRIGARFVDSEITERIKTIATICFPDVEFEKLNQNQLFDVRHLEAAQYIETDYFVTLNSKDMIINGRQEQLLEIGIAVREPKEQFIIELGERISRSEIRARLME